MRFDIVKRMTFVKKAKRVCYKAHNSSYGLYWRGYLNGMKYVINALRRQRNVK